jgi:hypothetical protein
MEQSAGYDTFSVTNHAASSGFGLTEENTKPQDGFLTKFQMQHLWHITASMACMVRILENLPVLLVVKSPNLT